VTPRRRPAASLLAAGVLVVHGVLPAPSRSATRPSAQPVTPRPLLNGVGPLEWNARLDSDRALAAVVPRWPAVRVLDPVGNESLFVYPARARVPLLLGTWPRGARIESEGRIFPAYRWILIIGPPDSAAAAADTLRSLGAPLRAVRVYAANGSPLFSDHARGTPLPAGRDFVLWPDTVSITYDSMTLLLRRLPSGEARAGWLASAGYGAASPLENFFAVNLKSCLDPATGIRQDLLRLLDLEGKVLWSRPALADFHEFAVSDFGDVAIARDRALRVYDRFGSERFRAPLRRNVVGRTAMGADGRFVLVATRAAGIGRTGADLWLALHDTKRKTRVWARTDLSDRPEAEPTELSVSDDGQRVLVRLTSGSVLLLGPTGATIARFDLPRVAGGEAAPGSVPRRTWLSPDGTLVGLTTPVARSRGEALGWLYEVRRRSG
jgi:hypothetical protein